MTSQTSNTSSPWVLALLATVVFLAVVNGTMINVGLPYIGRDFDVSEGTYGWIVTGYTLAFGIFNAINGRLGDIFGVKRFYVIGIGIFGLASLAVALSPTIEVAIAVRILQGAGAAAMPVLGSTIISKTVSAESRGRAMGIILSTVGVAASIGPFLGGILVQFFGWRSIFVFTGLVLLCIPAAIRLLPASLNDTEGERFDWVGAILMGAGIATLMYGFQIVESSGFTWILAADFALAFGLLGAFLVWIHRSDEPFVAPSLLRNRGYVTTAFVAFLTNATRFGTIVLVPIFLTEINGLEPVWIGAVLFPGALAIAVLSTRAGSWADRVGPRLPIGTGSIFVVMGNLICAYFAGGSPIGVAVGMGLYGVGFAFIQSPSVSAASQIVAPGQAGVGMGIFMMTFFIGGAVGVALSVTAVELQAVEALSWIGLSQVEGARFSNAILVLTGLAVVAVLALPSLPSREDLNASNHLAKGGLAASRMSR